MILIDLHDGELRPFQFGALALGRFELAICGGASFYGVIGTTLDARPPFYVLAGLLWAGLNDERLSYEVVCQLLDGYVKDSGDIYDGRIWKSILDALYEANIFREVQINPVQPLRDPVMASEDLKEILKNADEYREQKSEATEEQYEARIQELKKQRRDWKRQMGANL